MEGLRDWNYGWRYNSSSKRKVIRCRPSNHERSASAAAFSQAAESSCARQDYSWLDVLTGGTLSELLDKILSPPIPPLEEGLTVCQYLRQADTAEGPLLIRQRRITAWTQGLGNRSTLLPVCPFFQSASPIAGIQDRPKCSKHGQEGGEGQQDPKTVRNHVVNHNVHSLRNIHSSNNRSFLATPRRD